MDEKEDKKEESDDELEDDHLMVYETADGLTIIDSAPHCCHGHDHEQDHHHDAHNHSGNLIIS